MSPKLTRDIVRSLEAKGFAKENSHHKIYFFYVGGLRSSVKTHISHGHREYSDNLLGQMAKQLSLKRQELDDLIDCPLSEEDYKNMLIQKGVLKIKNT